MKMKMMLRGIFK